MPRSISRVALLGVLAALAAAAGGCRRGPTWNLAPVEGTVSKGGRPLASVRLVFLADAGTVGPRAAGITDDAGHYRLRTDHGEDGAVVGKHRVVILEAERLPSAQARRRDGPLKKAADGPLGPPQYRRFDQTPLRAEVHPGPQTLDFDIP
jgi:hypothetical protein